MDAVVNGADAQSLIRVQALGKDFVVEKRPLPVFQDIAFDVQAGEFLSIIGPSGCGKSTLLQVIAGLQRATHGETYFGNTKVAGPPKGMIYVFQQYTKSVFPWRTVEQNMAFGLEN